MSNFGYSSFSTNAPQSPESRLRQQPEYLNSNPLQSSQGSTSSSRPIQMSLDELQSKFALVSAEVDRLLILNSLMSKETEQWRKKYLEVERSGTQKTSGGDSSYYQQRIKELEDRVEAKDREIRDLRMGGGGSPTSGGIGKDQEIQYWKEKNRQTEQEYLQKIQNIKTQTEGILREQIEREVKAALRHTEEEKRQMQAQLDAYKRGNQGEMVKRAGMTSPLRDNATEDRINQLEGEKRALADLVRNYENRVNSLMSDNSSLTDRLRAIEEKSFNLNSSLRTKDDIERQLYSLQDNNRRQEAKLRENQNELDGLRQQKITMQSENENLNRKIREYDSAVRDLNNEIERLRRTTNQASQLEFEYNNLNRKTKDNENELGALRRADIQKNEDLTRARIENERLVNQKNELENRIQGYEREKAEYQNALELLKQKFRDFEGKMGLMLQENEKLKSDLDSKERELSLLRNTPTYEREANDLKRQLTTNEERVRDERNEIARKVQSLEEVINRERNESARLKELLRPREAEIENWKQKYQTLERDTQNYIQKLLAEAEGHFKTRIEQEKNEIGQQISAEKNAVEKQLRLNEQQLNDREREIAHLRDENNNLGLQAKQLTQELNNLKARTDAITREGNARIEEFRKKYENDQKIFLENELKNLQSQLNDRVILYEQEIKRLTEIIREHELRQILFFIEIERLYLVNGEFIEEINRITEEINHLIAENDKLNQQIIALRQNNQDRAKYEEIINSLQVQLEDNGQRVQALMAENARLGDTSVARLKEINNLKNSYATRAPQETAKRSQPDMRQSQADLNELNLRFDNERTNWEGQNNQLRQALEQNKREYAKLQDINNQRKSENENLRQELDGVRGASWQAQNLESELRLQNEQYQQSLKEVEEMRKARDFYRLQYDQVSAKLKESLNDKIKGTTTPLNWQPNDLTPGFYTSPKGQTEVRFK